MENINIHNKTIDQIFNESQSKYILVGFDEIMHWVDPIKKKLNKAICVYLVKYEPTNNCSFMVDYPAIEIYNSFDIKNGFEENDEILDAENDVLNNEYRYFGESLIPYSYYAIPNDRLYYNDDPEDLLTEEDIIDGYCSNRMLY